MGVSFDEFCRYCAANKLPVPAPGDFTHLRNMPREVAEMIYEKHFMWPLRFDELPAGVDHALFDFAVNSGIGGALAALRKTWMLPEGKPKWKIEPALWDKLTKGIPTETIAIIQNTRLRIMQSSKSWNWARRGWVPRLKRSETRARMLARESDPVHPEGRVKALPEKGKEASS
jgi:lysozyme family protein